MTFYLRLEGGRGARNGGAAKAERKTSSKAQGRNEFDLLRNRKVNVSGA